MDELLQTAGSVATQMGELLAFDPALLNTPEVLVRLSLMVVLLAGSAFFSSAETALFSLSGMELRELRRSKHPATDTIHELLDQPRRLIISILCGNELINVAATANMASILLVLYTPEAVLITNLLIMVPLLLLLGEVTPKTIAVTDPLRVATQITAAPMAVWVRLVVPLRWLVQQLSERIFTLLGGEERAPENILQVDELRTLVEEVVASGELHAMERALIDNILAAGSTEVLQIMLPRTRVSFIDGSWPMHDIVTEVRRLRHRQLPVFRGSRDNVVGMLQAEDIARHLLDGHDIAALSLDALLRPVLAVPTTKMVDELFGLFLQQEARAAVVVDEFGGVEGIVTLSDLIVFIFGHGSSDEIPEEMLTVLDDGSWEIDGALRIDRFNSLIKCESDNRRFSTVAGLLLDSQHGRPQIGDSVVFGGATLTILAMDGLRIARIRVEPPEFASLRAEALNTPPTERDTDNQAGDGTDSSNA